MAKARNRVGSEKYEDEDDIDQALREFKSGQAVTPEDEIEIVAEEGTVTKEVIVTGKDANDNDVTEKLDVVVSIPVTLGGQKTIGFASNLQIDGDDVVADFVITDKEVFDSIAKHLKLTKPEESFMAMVSSDTNAKVIDFADVTDLEGKSLTAIAETTKPVEQRQKLNVKPIICSCCGGVWSIDARGNVTKPCGCSIHPTCRICGKCLGHCRCNEVVNVNTSN